ncbi:hypothetical protein NQT62_05390 [Limnobacter humi]|uniref:Lipoprotein n=1 Tax=Limnobacter humi TaxID=1778671 RepID=A0ABT1WEC4_9BURK|nr:hypothetical protein [Limnobacter humi]MCQ8895871.1 hypothetical protein [Limnobacter humi]
MHTPLKHTSAAVLLFATAACATITQGTKQTLIFKMDPDNTVCSLTRVDDGELGTVSKQNNSIVVSKDKDDIIALCTAPGYDSQTIKVVSHASSAGVASGILDLGITDLATGAMFVYPDEIRVNLNKAGQTSPKAPKYSAPL